MTFVEILMFIMALIVLYLLMRPLQNRLELKLRKLFSPKTKHNGKPIIDITDYAKKKNEKDK